ncbi:eukaryotic and archaeal DNA primase, large subunit-domain-containing protein [Peziza echinospora]|nr:eukaryotic and archaeal DNA primase, large subunit-domain-containing protein [Peziza echinospora]
MFQQHRIRAPDARKTHSFGVTRRDRDTTYPHRLNFYTVPPTEEITLDEFEQWAIDRLRVLGEIESCTFRNKTPEEFESTMKPLLEKYLPLSANTSASLSDAKYHAAQLERKKDHYSHFILRLAFARSDELRMRFSRAETALFRLRYSTDDTKERQAFISSLNFAWETVAEDEKRSLTEQLLPTVGKALFEQESFFKVDWERVPDLVDQRRVLIKRGKAYVPTSLQLSLVLAEFTKSLDKAMELTARALPRLDEDDRLVPILNHLSLGFTAPEYNSSIAAGDNFLTGAPLTAETIDSLVPHFPLCMLNLHSTLRRTNHLLHFSRLQYGLFLKGLGLSVDEALIFWRRGFAKISDDEFSKKYKYNVRHTYGLEGARKNYKPLSCQQILIEKAPGPGETHGCPYRHFSLDNLIATLQSPLMPHKVANMEVLHGVKQDVENKRYHIACNRVFEYVHAKELKKSAEGDLPGSVAGPGGKLRETIVHPNQYFELSWELTHPGARAARDGGGDVGGVVGAKEEP